jgi:flagellar biosynthesis/type III secretory pathway M-ring protein FliF/YscJ
MKMNKMKETSNAHKMQYNKLVWMVILSFIAMFILMYSMVDRFANVYPNINQIYMAGLMTMPMIIIEVLLMRSMYMNKKLNAGIIAVSAIALIAFFLLIRQQTAVLTGNLCEV